MTTRQQEPEGRVGSEAQPTQQETLQRDSFILRIWWEGNKSRWKGLIQHVASGEAALVQSTAELLAFVERQTGKLSNAGRQGLK